ncbi:MFS transporter [Streptosporangium roseum]|uniref:MFS transporter n=1 Tax=Streptosporangium roseum TaxID=2001 RepID=UPI00146D99A3|nr:MFS transporter [Streptosporangium roseum]
MNSPRRSVVRRRAGRPSDRRVIVVVVGVQLAISLGFFAVMAHLVSHLRHDLGMLAGTITLVLGARIAVQYALFLPVGAVTDLIGATRAGVLACVLRAAGFVLLGTADELAGLLGAAVLLGVGGALFHPTAQSLLAGLAPARRSRGFAAYVIAGQVAAVAGPPAGLLLLTAGFWVLAAAAAAAWALAAVLFTLLGEERRTAPGADPRHRTGRWAGARLGTRMVAGGVAEALRDRRFVRFAVVAAPSTLLADQIVTVVPLKDVGAGATTLFFSLVAMVATAVQPWCAAGGRGEHPWVLRSGLLCAAAGYLVLLATPSEGSGGQMAGIVAAAVLNGLANGLMQPALFQTVTRCAPAHRFGAYLGVLSFLSGACAFLGGLAVGRLFDAGGWGPSMALAALGLVALLSAGACGLLDLRRAGSGSAGTSAPVRVPVAGSASAGRNASSSGNGQVND